MSLPFALMLLLSPNGKLSRSRWTLRADEAGERRISPSHSKQKAQRLSALGLGSDFGCACAARFHVEIPSRSQQAQCNRRPNQIIYQWLRWRATLDRSDVDSPATLVGGILKESRVDERQKGSH